MHSDGVRAEDYFERCCHKERLDIKRVHNPCDFIVNKSSVEIKSARLFLKSNKDGKIVSGRYECWSDTQLQKLKVLNPWVCFIISHNSNFMVQGFIRANQLPNERKLSLSTVQKLKLKSPKDFLRLIKRKR